MLSYFEIISIAAARPPAFELFSIVESGKHERDRCTQECFRFMMRATRAMFIIVIQVCRRARS
jgi:hypothetical protein